jgi:hypothetical protein
MRTISAFWLSSVLALVAPADTVLAGNAPPASHSTPIAYVDIPSPRQGHLLHLRGIAGRGAIYFKVDGACSKMPVRLAAGDFAGREPRSRERGRIQMLVASPDLVFALMSGTDLVSDMMNVASDPADATADIHLIMGLSPDTGFVLNPGRNVVSDVFPSRPKPIDCEDAFSRFRTH